MDAVAVSLNDVRLVPLQALASAGATLAVAEFKRHVPFPVQRAFIVRADQAGVQRGRHVHRKLRQFMICMAGKIELAVDDGTNRRSYTLSAMEQGICLPPGIWAEQTYLTKDSMLLVLCDAPYDEADYIRDYQAFLDFKRAGRPASADTP